jgi:hypothetical protein
LPCVLELAAWQHLTNERLIERPESHGKLKLRRRPTVCRFAADGSHAARHAIKDVSPKPSIGEESRYEDLFETTAPHVIQLNRVNDHDFMLIDFDIGHWLNDVEFVDAGCLQCTCD